MHELQIAQNIISIINDELIKNKTSKYVEFVNLVTGRMRAIIPETLMFSFDVQKKGYEQLENAKLIIDEVDINVKCNDCDHQVKIKEPQFHCPKCHSTNISIISGNELYVDSIELFD